MCIRDRPRAAYAAYVHGLSSRWSYLLRTIPDIDDLLQPLENAIHQHLIPALIGRPPCSSIVRDLFALPVRLGGLGLRDPSATSSESFQSSERITAPLVALITSQDANESIDPDTTSTIKKEVKKRNRQKQDEQARIVYDQLTPELRRCADLSTEKGSFPRGCLSSRLKNMVSIYTKASSGMHYACDMDGDQTTLLRPVTVVLSLQSTIL